MSHWRAMLRRSPSATVNIVDETFIGAPPALVSACVADPGSHRQWWPHLRLRTTRDRGVKGQRWDIDGQIVGTMEIWLEPFWDGVILHHYVRGQVGPRAPRDAGLRHTLRWKRSVTGLKDSLESRAL
jgi:hypothetical protein